MSAARPTIDRHSVLFRLTAEVGPEPLASAPENTTGSSGAMWAGIEILLYEDLEAVAATWQDFEHTADRMPFQTFGWLAAWQRQIGALSGVRPAIVLGRQRNGDLAFILPLSVEHRGLLRRLTFLGADLADYNGPLLAADFRAICEPGRFRSLWAAVLAVIDANPRLRFDLVELRKMPERIGEQPNPFLELPVTPNASGAHRSTLSETWESYYGRRSSATRRRDRTKLNRLAAHGEVAFVEPQTAADVEATLLALFEQKAQSFARMGVRNLFDLPGYRDFFLDVACNPDLRQIVHVAHLQVGSEIAATTLGLRLRGCYYYLLASYKDGEISRYGPGAVHLRHLLRTAIERGFHHFDFTIGDEAYKRDWCDEELKLYDHNAARHVWAMPFVLASTMLRRAKRFIKQTPVLWRAFSKARALAASLELRFGRPEDGPTR